MEQFKALGIESRAHAVLDASHRADLVLVAANQPVALVAILGQAEPSWARFRAYMQPGLPVFAVPPAALQGFAKAWHARDLRALAAWRVAPRGHGVPPL